jgi:hypothetical protein
MKSKHTLVFADESAKRVKPVIVFTKLPESMPKKELDETVLKS